ncbi:hypothetical protein XA68_16270 [Ophiocordyceps unilateralis]|uniref:BRCT domain-containing protein n=1 Tax=Ophiocordyceps unilateralis TaxID=268505 RepID=A0A2A9P589_OPHUN|nr:hypothetical protein XA68_16270 [Ophiocordyceps unilateralis]
METPPKRMTRARAAAKAAKIVTPAAKAKKRTGGTATASTKSTAAKRKTRTDENEQEDATQQQTTTGGRALRARPGRAAVVETQEEAAAPAKVARTRLGSSKSSAGEESSRGRVGSAQPSSAPSRARGRPRKTAVAEAEQPAPEAAREKADQQPASEGATKAATRSRAGVLANKASVAKPVVKKTVKFQEPDKENVGPRVKAKEPVTTGLRGRPARRGGGASTTTRAATRAAATTTTSAAVGQKKPLGPKKVTQMPIPREDDSTEDELAVEKSKTSKASPSKQAVLSPVKQPMTSPLEPVATSPIESPSRTAHASSDGEHDDGGATTEVPAPSDGTTSSAGSLLGSSPKKLPSSPFKVSMKSPARRMGPRSITESSCAAADAGVKTPLLQSAAKRPQSPIKGLNLPPAAGGNPPQKTQSAMKSIMFQSPAKRAMPSVKPLTEPRARGGPSTMTDWTSVQPLLMATPVRLGANRPFQELMEEESTNGKLGDDELLSGHPADASPLFTGRLSSVMPRHADPALRVEAATAAQQEGEIQLMTEAAQDAADVIQVVPDQGEDEAMFLAEKQASGLDDEDAMSIDDMVAQMEDSADLTPPTTASWAQQPAERGHTATYQLREKDMNPYDDLEWDTDSENGLVSGDAMAPTPARPVDGRRATMGLTSLAEQFESWSTASPVKVQAGSAIADAEGAQEAHDANSPRCDETPYRGSFFDEGMLGFDVSEQTGEAAGDLSLDDIVMTDEDVALAQEAHDMSVMGLEEATANVHSSFDDGLSEASQEYGDENQMPLSQAPMTPTRPQTRMMTFHTTSKVPLKPADESTPSPLKKRSMSVSRVATARRRPSALSRSATVISYSPTKASDDDDDNSALLQGAVVFVDVHTDEGGDASAIFVELLGQMGARCVKTWHWSPDEGELSSQSNVGITHVVFKDGSKRTLEKVRAAGGLVRCVGANWVLDCERQGQRLDEAPYIVDTSLVARGGARRRKSMEPKALAKINGSKTNRRDSTMWMHVPLSGNDELDGHGDEQGGHGDDTDWSQMMLTPVPKTPAPEAVARYAAELPSDDDEDEDDGADYGDGFASTQEALATRTCPSKRSQYIDMGEGILGRNEDEMRLMAARRKSLPFAPKRASPLSRTWE